VSTINFNAQAEDLLRLADVRTTPTRVIVLATLLQQPRALSHLELHEALAHLDRVTLYRALDCLTEAGIVHKISSDDRSFRYSASANKFPIKNLAKASSQRVGTPHQHGHFKCNQCARVFCLEQSLYSEALQHQLQASLQLTTHRDFKVQDIDLTIKGWCADCAPLANRN
jgi:Fur family transcriptional regulator, ferric uptake regulator